LIKKKSIAGGDYFARILIHAITLIAKLDLEKNRRLKWTGVYR
jgi:hypothetical protein